MTEFTWLGKDGNLIEAVVAVMFSRRHQTAVRIRASIGDGGIDIQVPSQHGSDIYQVKGYAQNLVASQKVKITKSFARMRSYTREAGITVTSWNLVTPLDPTKENMIWFRKFTDEPGLDCHWLGKSFADGLAAEFPDVIEYYFGDGKDRVLETIRQALETGDIIRRGNDSANPHQLSPSEIEPGLLNLFTILNKFDPNYLYAPAITPTLPSPKLDDSQLIFEYSHGQPGQFLTFYVYPKHPSVTDEPMPMVQVLFEVEVGSESHEAIEKFLRYGAPAVLSSRATSVNAKLPGGLGGEFKGGTITVGPTEEDRQIPDRQIRIQVISPDREVIAETILCQKSMTMGPDRTGARCESTEENGCFTLESLFDIPEQAWKLNLTEHDISGRAPTAVLPGLRVLAALHPPNAFRFVQQYGPADTDPIPIPDSWEGNSSRLPFAEALDTIQQHTPVQLTIPVLTQTSPSGAHDIMLSAKILQGHRAETRLTLFSGPFPASPDIEDAQAPYNISGVMPHRVTVGSDVIDLGWRAFAAHQVMAELSPLEAGGTQITLTPFEGNSFLMQYMRADEPPVTSSLAALATDDAQP